MYSHAIILAALSAGALAQNTANVYLTAFAPTDLDCTGDAVGNNVTFSAPMPTQPGHAKVSSCIAYAPGHDQNIQFDYFGPNTSFTFWFYGEPNCKNITGHVRGSWEADNCYPMNNASYDDTWANQYKVYGADWKSAQVIFDLEPR